MLYAIMSDVHSNLEALQKVLQQCGERGVDGIFCLGDTVGYGADPDECCSLLRKSVSAAVLGNHDAAVCGRLDYHFYYDHVRQVLDRHRSIISKPNLDWLLSLPYTLHHHQSGGDFLLSHGAPSNPERFQYLFSPEQASQVLGDPSSLPCATFIGHSHLKKVFTFGARGGKEVHGNRIQLQPDEKYVITVGSVGQPRDFDARPCFVLYDTSRQEVEFVRTDYPVDEAARKILRSDNCGTFAKRLFLGS